MNNLRSVWWQYNNSYCNKCIKCKHLRHNDILLKYTFQIRPLYKVKKQFLKDIFCTLHSKKVWTIHFLYSIIHVLFLSYSSWHTVWSLLRHFYRWVSPSISIMSLNEGLCWTCSIVETFSVCSSVSSTLASSFTPWTGDWLLTCQNLGERVGEKDGETVGDLGDPDWPFLTADDTAWANLEGVDGEYGLGAAKLLNFSKLNPRLPCLVTCCFFSSPSGLLGVTVAPSSGSSRDCVLVGGGGGGGRGVVSFSKLLCFWIFSAAEVT